MTRIVTERLTLRRPEASDWPGFRAHFASQRSRFMKGPRSESDSWRSFCTELGHWQMRGYGMFAVTETGQDACLGLVGPWFPVGWPETEIGWMLWPEGEGKGYGFEAANACLDHVFAGLGWTTAVSYVDEANLRSIALAEKLGAAWDESAPTLGPETRVYRHPRRTGASQ